MGSLRKIFGVLLPAAGLILHLACSNKGGGGGSAPRLSKDDPSPPAQAVKLIFIHQLLRQRYQLPLGSLGSR